MSRAGVPATNGAEPSCDNTALRAAVDWCVRLESGGLSEAERLAFEHWRSADVRHAQAWAQVGRLLDNPLNVVRGLAQQAPGQAHVAHAALLSPRRRKLLRGALMVAGVASGTAFLANRVMPVSQLLADVSTGTGERREVGLPDGSRLLLNARSAVNIRFSEVGRIVELRAGELIASVRRDLARSFSVESIHGRIAASEGQFMAGLHADGGHAVALSHAVAVETHGGQRLRLEAGEGAIFTAGQIQRMAGAATTQASWQEGVLTVEDQPLGEVVQALRAYYPGIIRVSREAESLRVFGMFPLEDPEQVLQLLAHTLPLDVRRHGWVVLIGRHASQT